MRNDWVGRLQEPVRRADKSLRQQGEIEAQVRGQTVDCFLLGRQQGDQ